MSSFFRNSSEYIPNALSNLGSSSSANNRSKEVPLLTTEESDPPPPSEPAGDDRACFLCLEGDLEDDLLVPCCTRCSAHVHNTCWTEFRYQQRVASLRSRFLREPLPRSQLLCTICKTGNAIVRQEDEGILRNWMYLGDGGDGDANAPNNRRRGDSDDEDIIDLMGNVCSFRVVCVNMVISVMVVTGTSVMMANSEGYTGDTVILIFLGLYEVMVMQMVILFVYAKLKARSSGGAVT